MPLIRVAPDARGLLLEGSAAAVARAEDGILDVVFHGFLSNGAELAQRLSQPPTNEAELLLSGYVEHGRALFQELRGAFALVVWDARARLLLATRDPVGIHPLFYTRIGRDLVLSWSIDALLAAGAPRDVNRVYVAEHLLHRWRSLDETYFSSIRRVPAGHFLRFGTGIDVERYWRPLETVPTVAAGGDAWVDELEYRLEQAVERCLELGRAGVYLSGGGVDSTTVAVAAARTSARRGLPLPVALCVGFPDAEANEEEEQRQVAAALGLTRRTRSADARASGDVPLIESSLGTLAVRGAPIGIPWDGAFLALVGDARGCGCSVVLTGDGGDEWLTVSRVRSARPSRTAAVGTRRPSATSARPCRTCRCAVMRIVLRRRCGSGRSC